MTVCLSVSVTPLTCLTWLNTIHQCLLIILCIIFLSISLSFPLDKKKRQVPAHGSFLFWLVDLAVWNLLFIHSRWRTTARREMRGFVRSVSSWYLTLRVLSCKSSFALLFAPITFALPVISHVHSWLPFFSAEWPNERQRTCPASRASSQGSKVLQRKCFLVSGRGIQILLRIKPLT